MVSLEEKQSFIEACRDDPVFFVEKMLIAESGKNYKLEPHQKEFLRCDDSYRMLFWARRLSKSTTTRFDMLHKALFIPNLKCLAILPSWSQATDYGGEIQDTIGRSPLIDQMFQKSNVTTMILQNNSRINLASAGKEGISQLGRGARYMVYDEAQQISDQSFGFTIPILRGVPGKKWRTYSGTPLGKIGTFWEVYQDARKIIEKAKIREVNAELPSGEQVIVFQRQTAYLDEYGEIIESGTNRLTIEELRADRKRMGETTFLREYCLQWLDTIGEVFPKELVESITLTESHPKFSSTQECVVGVDLGKNRNNSVVTVGERQKGDKIRIIFIKSFPLGTAYDIVVDYCLRELPRKYPNIRKMMVDQGGVGEAVIDSMNRAQKFKIDGFNFGNAEKKKSLVEASVWDMERGKVEIIANQRLINELLEYKREISEKSHKFLYGKASGGSDDYVDSLMLCLLAERGTLGNLGKMSVVSTGAKVLDGFSQRFGRKRGRGIL